MSGPSGAQTSPTANSAADLTSGDGTDTDGEASGLRRSDRISALPEITPAEGAREERASGGDVDRQDTAIDPAAGEVEQPVEPIKGPTANQEAEAYQDPLVLSTTRFLILILAVSTFLAPSAIATVLRRHSGFDVNDVGDLPDWLLQIVPLFHGWESGSFAWLLGHWEAIPMLAVGAVLLRPKLIRFAALLTVVIALGVAIWSSVELYYWGNASTETQRALASSLGDNLSTNLDRLAALYRQVDKTQNVAIAFIAAVLGGTMTARSGKRK